MGAKNLKRTIAAASLIVSGSVLADDLPQAFIALPVGTQASGVSADGSVVTGTAPSGGAFRWTEAGGYVEIGGGGGGLPSISADGQTITANAIDSEGRINPAIWLGGTAWQMLGGINEAPCVDGNTSFGTSFGVSGDGSTVVGLSYAGPGCLNPRGFSWQESTGMVDLGSLVPNRPSRANDISDDGQVIVGWNDNPQGLRLGVKWVDGVEQWIMNGSNFNGEVQGVNRDGSIMVGRFCNFDGGNKAWVWDEATGVTCMGFPGTPPMNNGLWDTSDDGRVMGGWFDDNPFFREAVIYLDRQPVFLEQYLADHGFPQLASWNTSGAVLAVSANRRVLAGWARNQAGQLQGWVVKLGLDSPQLQLAAGESGTSLQWGPVTNSIGYDVVRGDLAPLLASGGDFSVATDVCLASDIAETSWDDAAVPEPGEAYWYLVRPKQFAGPGSYDTYLPSQVGSRDLEIDDSPFGCN